MRKNRDQPEPPNDFAVRLEVCQRLAEWERQPQPLEVLLDRSRCRLGPACKPVQTALLTHLVSGVVRWQKRLDFFIESLQQRPQRLKAELRAVLRLGLFELDCELGASRPAWAVVSESVDLARRLTPGREGFVNGILRSFQRRGGAAKLLPPEDDRAENLARRWSLPEWLIAEWQSDLGPETALGLCRQANLFAGTTFRVNRLRLTRKEFLARAEAEKPKLGPFQPGCCCETSFNVPAAAELLASDWFREGLITVQDEGAQLIGELLAPKPGELVLDACAAPGGKSTHLAELSGDRALIFAVDRDRKRLPRIEQSCRRLGLAAIRVRAADLSQPLPSELDRQYDAILIDAPCSGLGTIRRRPDLRWRKQPQESRELQKIQLRILRNCSRYLKPGGRLVYATCTTARAENQAVIESFLAAESKFRLAAKDEIRIPGLKALLGPEGFLETFRQPAPNRQEHPLMDGFFAARLSRCK